MTATNSGQAIPPLAKYLASNEKKTRDKAIKNLAGFLSNTPEDGIPRPELSKLWKGIFYCFWMSDKPLVQQALASELAELVLAITTTTSSLTFLDMFWETIVREWNGIDRLRMDKYYMLVRRFVNASLRLLLRSKWEAEAVERYNTILTREGGPLCPTDIRVPTSLAFHLADIYLEELDKVMLTEDNSTSVPAPIAKIISPFLELAAGTPSSVTHKHIQAAVFIPLIETLPVEEDDGQRQSKRIRLDKDAPPDEEYPNLSSSLCFEEEGDQDCIRSKVLRRIFDVASRPETTDPNRRKMYALWKRYSNDSDDGA